MPKGRKKRHGEVYGKLSELIKDQKEGCVCLMNGICVCIRGVPSQHAVAMTSGERQYSPNDATDEEPDTPSNQT